MLRTAESWRASFETVSALAGLTADAALWVPGPARATMNLFARVHAELVGARLVDTLGEATHAALSPAALDRVVGSPDLAGTTVVVAGDRLSRALHHRASAAGATVHHYYGAAELSFVGWGSHAEDLRVFPGVEVRISDGEIWVRSPFLCEGYDGPPGALRRSPDGFATVGDLGRLEGDLLRVVGRPAAVTTGGATVRLAEVEAELVPLARGEVVVVGVPHPELGAVLGAVLTDASDHVPLREAARNRLVPAARPRIWWHLDDLPRTPAGKPDREGLARTAAAGALPRLT